MQVSAITLCLVSCLGFSAGFFHPACPKERQIGEDWKETHLPGCVWLTCGPENTIQELNCTKPEYSCDEIREEGSSKDDSSDDDQDNGEPEPSVSVTSEVKTEVNSEDQPKRVPRSVKKQGKQCTAKQFCCDPKLVKMREEWKSKTKSVIGLASNFVLNKIHDKCDAGQAPKTPPGVCARTTCEGKNKFCVELCDKSIQKNRTNCTEDEKKNFNTCCQCKSDLPEGGLEQILGGLFQGSKNILNNLGSALGGGVGDFIGKAKDVFFNGFESNPFSSLGNLNKSSFHFQIASFFPGQAGKSNESPKTNSNGKDNTGIQNVIKNFNFGPKRQVKNQVTTN